MAPPISYTPVTTSGLRKWIEKTCCIGQDDHLPYTVASDHNQGDVADLRTCDGSATLPVSLVPRRKHAKWVPILHYGWRVSYEQIQLHMKSGTTGLVSEDFWQMFDTAVTNIAQSVGLTLPSDKPFPTGNGIFTDTARYHRVDEQDFIIPLYNNYMLKKACTGEDVLKMQDKLVELQLVSALAPQPAWHFSLRAHHHLHKGKGWFLDLPYAHFDIAEYETCD